MRLGGELKRLGKCRPTASGKVGYAPGYDYHDDVERNHIFSIFSKVACKLMCSLRYGLFKLKLKSNVSHQFRN